MHLAIFLPARSVIRLTIGSFFFFFSKCCMDFCQQEFHTAKCAVLQDCLALGIRPAIYSGENPQENSHGETNIVKPSLQSSSSQWVLMVTSEVA
mmetsp:Transcript_19606/g.23097  ORF Transcript_19606/g.23097 Transcript_19606/m.23097 type:complete len:94 (-) Transcript_19606:241-522(-)